MPHLLFSGFDSYVKINLVFNIEEKLKFYKCPSGKMITLVSQSLLSPLSLMYRKKN